MRPIDELINMEESALPLVQKVVNDSKLVNRVLPVQKESGKKALYNIQVTSRSPMGAVTLYTGGILVDHGWLRILGSGYEKLVDIATCNDLSNSDEDTGIPESFTIAYDITGGMFALNGGALGSNLGEVYYFGLDSLEWQETGLSYSNFLEFAFSEKGLDKFYSTLRWYGWEEEVENLPLDQVFSFYPYLWTQEGQDVNQNFHSPVPLKELLAEVSDFINFSKRHEI